MCIKLEIKQRYTTMHGQPINKTNIVHGKHKMLHVSTPEYRYFVILYNDQQMHNYFTNYHTPTCFDTIVSSARSS